MSVSRVIAIGASAGGLEVIRQIVRALPTDFPAALLVVLHLPRTAPSLLPEILGRSTKLAVVQGRDGQSVEPAHVYVAPPDHPMWLHGEALRLARGPLENDHRPPPATLSFAQRPCLMGRAPSRISQTIRPWPSARRNGRRNVSTTQRAQTPCAPIRCVGSSRRP